MAIQQTHTGTSDPTIVGPSALIAALGGGIAAGLVLYTTGRMGSVAGMYGLEGVVAGWIVHVVHSLIAGALFAGIVAAVSARDGLADLAYDLHDPASGAVLGLVFGLLLWLVVVAFALPIWLEFVGGSGRPIPYFHWPSLASLLLFGGILGGGYPLVKEALEDRS